MTVPPHKRNLEGVEFPPKTQMDLSVQFCVNATTPWRNTTHGTANSTDIGQATPVISATMANIDQRSAERTQIE